MSVGDASNQVNPDLVGARTDLVPGGVAGVAAKTAFDIAGNGGTRTVEEAKELLEKQKKAAEALGHRREKVVANEFGAYEWKTGEGSVDAQLYQQAKIIAEKIPQIQAHMGANEELNQALRNLQEVVKAADGRMANGEQAFSNPEEIMAVVYALELHKLNITGALPIDISKGGQLEKDVVMPAAISVERDRVVKTGRHGEGLINPGLINWLRQQGINVSSSWPERLKGLLWTKEDEKLKLKFSISETGERVVDKAYLSAWHTENWETSDIVDHLQGIDDLEVKVFEVFGLDPQNRHELGLIDVLDAKPGKYLLLNAYSEQLANLLNGHTLESLPIGERHALKQKALELASISAAESVAKRVRSGEVSADLVSAQYREDLARIEDNIHKRETGEAHKEEVEVKIVARRKKTDELQSDISRWENYMGIKRDTEGNISREGGLLFTAREELATAEIAAADKKRAFLIARKNYGPSGKDNAYVTKKREQRTIEVRIKTCLATEKTLTPQTTGLEQAIKTLTEAYRGASAADKQDIQQKLVIANERLGQARGKLAANNTVLEQSYSRRPKIPDELVEMQVKLEAARLEQEAAERELRKKRTNINKYLEEFGQRLAGVGVEADDDAARDRLVLAKRRMLERTQKALAELEDRKLGKPETGDLEIAGELRALKALSVETNYTALVGNLTTEQVRKMGDARNPEASHEAILEAVIDSIGYEVEVDDGKGTKTRKTEYLTQEQKKKLFSRGEVVLLAIQRLGVKPEEVFTGDILDAVNIYQDNIRILLEAKPDGWEDDIRGSREAITGLMAQAQFERVLPILASNTERSRILVRESIKYLRQKAASGKLDEIPILFQEQRPLEERFAVETQIPNTEYGQASFFAKDVPSTLPAIDVRLRREGKHPHDVVEYFVTTPQQGITLRLATEIYTPSGAGKQLYTRAQLRNDMHLYDALPPTQVAAQAAGWPAAILDKFYDPATGNKFGINVVDHNNISVSFWQSPDNNFDNAIANLVCIPDLQEALPAAVTKRILEMPPAERQNILGRFEPVALRFIGLNWIVENDNGLLYLTARNIPAPLAALVPGNRITLKEFLDNIVSLTIKAHNIGNPGAPITELAPPAFQHVENMLRTANAAIGKNLLKSILDKSKGA